MSNKTIGRFESRAVLAEPVQFPIPGPLADVIDIRNAIENQVIMLRNDGRTALADLLEQEFKAFAKREHDQTSAHMDAIIKKLAAKRNEEERRFAHRVLKRREITIKI